MSLKLNIFLNNHRLEKNLLNSRINSGIKATHYSIPNPGVHRGGSLYITEDELTIFYKMIGESDKICAINEVHLEKYSQILIDLDFRKSFSDYSNLDSKRLYTKNQIEIFLLELYKVIEKYSPRANCSDFDSYLMEKSSSKYFEKNGLKMIKDGVHIVFPNSYLPYSVLHLIRNDIITNENIIKLFSEDMKLDDSISNIYDESVIQRNGWMIYGTAKPESKPYKITSAYSFDKKLICNLENLNLENLDEYDLITFLSIRKVIKPTELVLDENQYEILYNQLKSSRLVKKKRTIDNDILSDQGYHFAKHLVENCLSNERSDNYYEWYKLGICLNSIDNRLRETFIEFSKRSNKYIDEDDCDKTFYNTDNKVKLNHWEAWESLINWVKNDS